MPASGRPTHLQPEQQDYSRTGPAAVVLGGGVNGLGVIRSLGRLGVAVGLVGAAQDGDHAYRSKYLAATRQLTKGFEDEDLLAGLLSVRDELPGDRPILFPAADRYSQFLCREQDTLVDRFVVNCAAWETNESFLDKWRTAEICEKHGIRIPRTACPDSLEELSDIATTFRYPVIIKPRYTFDSVFPGKNASVYDPAGLIAFFEQHSIMSTAVIQEIIPSGDGDILVTSSYSDNQGVVRAMYSGRKIRQHLPDYGATCFGVSETYPELIEQTRNFLDAIGYRGFAMAEFARSREDGLPYFIELNTRTSWTNQLYADAGVDCTQIAYWDLAAPGEPNPAIPQTQTDNVFWLDFRRDLASMRLKREAGDISLLEGLATLPKATSFAHWDRRDPAPFVAAIQWRLRKVLNRLPGVPERG